MKKQSAEPVTLREIKATLDELTEMMGFVVKHMATKEDLAELRVEFKGDIFTLQTQVNGMEADIREMRREWMRSSR